MVPLLWTLMMVVCNTQGQLFPSSDETRGFLEEQEAIFTLLRNSWLPGSTLVFVTDDTTKSLNPGKIADAFSLDYNLGFFKAAAVRERNVTQFHLSNLLSDVKRIEKSSKGMTLVVLSDDVGFLEKFIASAFSNDLLIWPSRLLIATRLPYKNLRHLQDDLSEVNGMVLITDKTSTSVRCGLHIYLPYSHRRINIASWSPESGLSYLSEHRLFPDKYKKFSDGAHLLVASGAFVPHTRFKEVENEKGEKTLAYSGPLVTLVDILAGRINFTHSIIRPPDKKWGIKLANGSWNGMVGMLNRKEVDFALGPFAITLSRSEAMDFTNPLLIDYLKILGGRGNTEVDPWGFMMPLTPSVWISMFAALVVSVVIVIVLFNANRACQSSVRVSFFNYIRILLQQDITDATISWWERLIVGGWMLTALIVVKSYSGNLTSLLAVRYVAQPYQSMRDVLDDPKSIMLWVWNTAFVQNYREAEFGVFHEVAESEKNGKIMFIKAFEYKKYLESHITRGDHVLLTPLVSEKMLVADDFTKTGKCRFYLSRETMMPFIYTMGLRKKSPLKWMLNEGIRALTESGIYMKLLQNEVPNSTTCDNPPTKVTVRSSLSITNLWGMFVFLVAGYMISLGVFCLEKIKATFD